MKSAPRALFMACILCTVATGGAAPAATQTSPEPETSGFISAVPKYTEKLEWPDDSYDREAFISLRIMVSPQGKVSEVTLDEDTGFYSPPFVKACINAAKAMRFKPATLNGKPVEQGFILPCKFSIGADGVSPEFKVEAQKVADLFKSGDYAGADFHAQWMLKETVRYGYEYALLQSTLAVTHASLGHDHEAIHFAEEASQRTSPNATNFSLHQPIPANSPHNYLLPREVIISLLNMRMRLAANNGMLKKALKAYYEVAGLEKIASDDPRVAAAAQLTAKLESSEPLAAKIVLVRSNWKHELYRRRFTMEHVSGIINSIALRCGKTRQPLTYVPGDEWTVPDGLQDCVVDVDGETGTTFQLIELAE